MTSLLERYRDRLAEPADESFPLTLGEGFTPLVRARRLGEELGLTNLHLKFEGTNPTGSFKDRGMVLAVNRALASGAQAVVCASTGNTSASAAAYAAAAGLPCFVLLPAGKVARGKLAQALAAGARLVMIDGNFDEALGATRRLGEDGHAVVVNSINPDRISGQQTVAWEICDTLGRAPDAVALPVGNAGNITAAWRGFRAAVDASHAAHARIPGRWRRANRARRTGGGTRDGGHRHQDRQPGVMGGRDDGARRLRRGHRGGHATRRSLPRSATSCGWRASSASLPRRRAWPACGAWRGRGASVPTRWSCAS